MKKIMVYFLWLFLFGWLVAACSDSHQDPTLSTDPSLVQEPLSLMSETSHVVGSKGGAIELRFKAEAGWTASSDQPWCLLSRSSGVKGSMIKITLTVMANENYDQREATVTLQAAKELVKIKVNQVQKNAILLAREVEYVPTEGGTFTYAFQTNVTGYEIFIDPACTWFREKPATRGLNKVELLLEFEANPMDEVRSAELFIRKDDLEQKVTFVQQAKKRQLRFVHTNSIGFVPVIQGDQFTGGQIDWGDLQCLPYGELLRYPYSDGKLQHTIKIDTYGATQVHFTELTGITEIDFSDF